VRKEKGLNLIISCKKLGKSQQQSHYHFRIRGVKWDVAMTGFIENRFHRTFPYEMAC
jgi:hypothetical protein